MIYMSEKQVIHKLFSMKISLNFIELARKTNFKILALNPNLMKFRKNHEIYIFRINIKLATIAFI